MAAHNAEVKARVAGQWEAALDAMFRGRPPRRDAPRAPAPAFDDAMRRAYGVTVHRDCAPAAPRRGGFRARRRASAGHGEHAGEPARPAERAAAPARPAARARPAERAAAPPPANATSGKRVVSYGLYGKNKKYTNGAIRNAEMVGDVFPGWVARFYCDATVPAAVRDRLADLGAEVFFAGVLASRSPETVPPRSL